MKRFFPWLLAAAVWGGGLCIVSGAAGAPSGWAPAVKPKPLSANVKQGLAWLVKHQHQSGGWGQGEESAHMGASLDKLRDMPNVADTCIAALALIRAGSTPSKGDHAKQIRAALDYVCREVEKSDEKGLFITETRGTRVQQKLGTYIDTFLASLLLAEVKGQMPDARGEKRVAAALNKVMDKIEKNQKEDGTWDNKGWAPVISQGMAAKAVNRAAQAGVPVSTPVRARAEGYAQRQYDPKTRQFGGSGAAGVDLYSSAANLGAMQDSENTNAQEERQLRERAKSAKNAAERREAEAGLKRIEDNRKQLGLAQAAVVNKLGDQGFVSGFGSNGGEEFLSYMNIGESLVVKAGPEWQKWDKGMTENLNRIQNKDGSWTGHHCITGRTFCTAAALLVLTVDRAPVPVAKLGRR